MEGNFEKMKICLFSSGFLNSKTIEYYLNNKEKFFDIINPDIYFHTYENEYLDDMKNLYNCKKIESEDCNKIQSFEKPQSVSENIHSYTKFENVMHMWRKRKLAFDMIDEKYDYYIYSRFDICLFTNFSLNFFEDISDSSVILIPNGGDYEGGYNDLMAIGTYGSMKEYVNLIENILNYSLEGCLFHPEILLRYHLNKKNINVKRFKMKMWINSGFYN